MIFHPKITKKTTPTQVFFGAIVTTQGLNVVFFMYFCSINCNNMAQHDSKGATKERTGLHIKSPQRYKVVLANDDFTPMDFVVAVLMQVFHKAEPEAYAIMLQVHNEGRGVAGIYTYDEALTRSNMATQWARDNGYPLRVNVEPE